jgi:tetratricopeptide (TPR) repeat protein
MFAAMAITLGAAAQEGPKITSAVIAMDTHRDTAEAKKYIDEADAIVKNKSSEEIGYKDYRKFLYYKGRINLAVAQSNNPAIKSLDVEALKKAEDALLETIKFEEKVGKEKYSDDAKVLLPAVAVIYNQKALDAYSANNYAEAYAGFLKTYELKKSFGQTDTSMLYNSALMAQNAKEYNKAVELNKQLLEMNYKGYVYKATGPDGNVAEFPNKKMMDEYVKYYDYSSPQTIKNDVRPDLYVAIAGLSLQNGDTATFMKYVKEGRAKYPENSALLTTELDIYLKSKQYDKALVNLDQAIAQNPNDPNAKIYYYNKGVIIHTQMNKPDEALASYKKAVELDSMYADALYMQGLVYYDKAKTVTEEMNQLPFSAKEKYKKMKAQQKELFMQALPYFEQALKATPKDTTTMQALREIYRSVGNSEKAIEMNNRLQEAGM